MTQTEALKLALEALKWSKPHADAELTYQEAITAIKAALEAKDEPWEKFCDSNCVWTDHHTDCKLAKDEPVRDCNRVECMGSNGCIDKCWKPQRTWVALTDEEISDCMEMSIQKTCRAIEAKLKDKNYD